MSSKYLGFLVVPFAFWTVDGLTVCVVDDLVGFIDISHSDLAFGGDGILSFSQQKRSEVL